MYKIRKYAPSTMTWWPHRQGIISSFMRMLFSNYYPYREFRILLFTLHLKVCSPELHFVITHLDVGLIAAGSCLGQQGGLQRTSPLPAPSRSPHDPLRHLNTALCGCGSTIFMRLLLPFPPPPARPYRVPNFCVKAGNHCLKSKGQTRFERESHFFLAMSVI